MSWQSTLLKTSRTKSGLSLGLLLATAMFKALILLKWLASETGHRNGLMRELKVRQRNRLGTKQEFLEILQMIIDRVSSSEEVIDLHFPRIVLGQSASYLLYVSSATQLLNHRQLHAIHQQASGNNQLIGISGLLLYKSGTFLQYLEGEQHSVLALFDKIKFDPRHTGIIEIVSGEVDNRNFADWSMGFKNMDLVDDFLPYQQYLDRNLNFRSFSKGSEDAYLFIRTFTELNHS
jgi:hypothetical protein